MREEAEGNNGERLSLYVRFLCTRTFQLTAWNTPLRILRGLDVVDMATPTREEREGRSGSAWPNHKERQE